VLLYGGQVSERTHHYDMVGEFMLHCSSTALAILHLPLIIISTSLAKNDSSPPPPGAAATHGSQSPRHNTPQR
jgi:hypothetical protein